MGSVVLRQVTIALAQVLGRQLAEELRIALVVEVHRAGRPAAV